MSFEARFTAVWLSTLGCVALVSRMVAEGAFEPGILGISLAVAALILSACAVYRWVKIAVAKPLEELAGAAAEALSSHDVRDWSESEPSEPIGPVQKALTKLRPALIEHRRVVTQLEHHVRHDFLTGALSRLHFEECFARECDKGTPLSLLLVDVDRFKEINDTFGHAGGDAVLKDLAAVMSSCVKADALLSRIGGDEFAILVSESTEDDARQLAQSILKHLEEAEGVLRSVRVSIGAATFPENCPTVQLLRESADLALYHAKQGGRARVCVSGDPGVNDRRRSPRSTLMTQLDAAMDSGQLQLHYQPKMCSRTNKIDSVEALIRWQHPVHGMLPPNDFIMAAEETGRIERLSEWTLKQAVADQAQLAAHGITAATYVNISGRLLAVPRFIQSLLDLTAGHENVIGLEITETAVIDHPEISLKHLNRMVDAGLKVAIDDYGVGLSSLTYLKQLPANELKIDRAFISDLTRTHRDPLLVRSTIDLAHALGMKVTAEGVEEAATLALLRVMGCDYIQGYLVAKPMPMTQLLAFLADASSEEFLHGIGNPAGLINIGRSSAST